MYSRLKRKIKELLECFRIPDPVKHCEVYRAEGCSHVDSFLCKIKDCPIRENYNEKTKPNEATIAAMEEAREISKRNEGVRMSETRVTKEHTGVCNWATLSDTDLDAIGYKNHLVINAANGQFLVWCEKVKVFSRSSPKWYRGVNMAPTNIRYEHVPVPLNKLPKVTI